MKKSFYIVLAVLFLFFVNSCSKTRIEESSSRSIILMTWNLYNLFDEKDDGNEYAEYREFSSWSVEKYLGRINSYSSAISSIELQPDIIILQEIKSITIIEDLASSLSGGYLWGHFANSPGASVGLGILSRFPFSDNRAHSITIDGDTIPRPVLETRINTPEGSFIIFSCHWKSKVGGDSITENLRKASARVILRRIRELWEDEPELGIIIAGDLNETHNEFYRQNAAYICALLPDDPYCAEITGMQNTEGEKIASLQEDFFILSGNTPPDPVHFPQGVIIFFSPWINELEKGSYYFKDNWESIDHFLVSAQFFTDTGWKYEKTVLLDNQPFTGSSGSPFRYNQRTGAGLSDHLPLLMTLRRD